MLAPGGQARFATTQWSVVLAASDGTAADARERLAQLYWYPLFAFARYRGASHEDAADAVQIYLARLLTGDALTGVTVDGGRFRDFLRTGLSHELVSRHRSATAARRRPSGGFAPFGCEVEAETRFTSESVDPRTPEQALDRLYARALLDQAHEELRKEYSAAGRETLFDHLVAHLDTAPEAVNHADAATRLGLAPGTVRNEAVALRRRLRQIVRRHVLATLDDPTRVDEELRGLLAAVARP